MALAFRRNAPIGASTFLTAMKPPPLDRLNGRRIETERTPHLGIPELRVVESGHPRSFHDTHETVLAFDGGFVAVPSEDQDFGIA